MYICTECYQIIQEKGQKCPDCGNTKVIYEPDYELYSEWDKDE